MMKLLFKSIFINIIISGISQINVDFYVLYYENPGKKVSNFRTTGGESFGRSGDNFTVFETL